MRSLRVPRHKASRVIRWLKLDCDFAGKFKSKKYCGHKCALKNQKGNFVVFCFDNVKGK